MKADRKLKNVTTSLLGLPRNRGVFCDGYRDCPVTIKHYYDEVVYTDSKEEEYHAADECNEVCHTLNISSRIGCDQAPEIRLDIESYNTMTQTFTLKCSEVRLPV